MTSSKIIYLKKKRKENNNSSFRVLTVQPLKNVATTAWHTYVIKVATTRTKGSTRNSISNKRETFCDFSTHYVELEGIFGSDGTAMWCRAIALVLLSSEVTWHWSNGSGGRRQKQKNKKQKKKLCKINKKHWCMTVNKKTNAASCLSLPTMQQSFSVWLNASSPTIVMKWRHS